VGEALHRLVGSIFLDREETRITEALLPLQQGVGVFDGAILLVRAVHAVLLESECLWLLHVDVCKAFNEPKRGSMFEAVRAAGFGAWIPFLRQYYGEPSNMLFFSVAAPAVLQSQQGVHQGDPMGSVLFNLTFQSVLRASLRALLEAAPAPRGLVARVQDDASIPQALARAFVAMAEEAPRIGLVLHRPKCRLWARDGSPVPRELAVIPLTRDGLVLPGCPLGTPAFLEQRCSLWVERDGLLGVAELPLLLDAKATFSSIASV
jgi:hypothetical protein